MGPQKESTQQIEKTNLMPKLRQADLIPMHRQAQLEELAKIAIERYRVDHPDPPEPSGQYRLFDLPPAEVTNG